MIQAKLKQKASSSHIFIMIKIQIMSLSTLTNRREIVVRINTKKAQFLILFLKRRSTTSSK